MRRFFRKGSRLLAGIWVFCAAQTEAAGEPAASPVHEQIIVLSGEYAAPLSPLIFGVNVLGYDPATYEPWGASYRGFSDYGAGLWDPRVRRPVPEVIRRLRQAAITSLRFPGGCGAHHYDWKTAIGPDRSRFRFGIDEFLAVCREVPAEPVLTLSYFTGEALDAADLIEYLNTPPGQNPNGGTAWSAERAGNGHEIPYGVRYVEVGNEVWHGDHRSVCAVSPQEYAHRYLAYYRAVKSVDPAVQVGLLLHDERWNESVLRIVRDRFDYGIIHWYLSAGLCDQDIRSRSPEEVFSRVLAETDYYEQELVRIQEQIRRMSGCIKPLALTEFNVAFSQEEPFPWRHCLGAALVNAELLRIFMQPPSQVMMAHYWNFCNECWGMISNGFVSGADLFRPYYNRPNYYLYELYARCFSGNVIRTESILTSGMPAGCSDLSVNACRDEKKRILSLIVVNRNMEQDLTATIELDMPVFPTASVLVLNGDGVSAHNETNARRVGISESTMTMQRDGQAFVYTFAAHSISAVEFSFR